MGRWTEVTWGRQQLVIRIHPFAPFTYRGLEEFHVLVEDELENLDDDLLERQHAANQLFLDLLVEPIVHQKLPNTLTDWMSLGQHLMKTYGQ